MGLSRDRHRLGLSGAVHRFRGGDAASSRWSDIGDRHREGIFVGRGASRGIGREIAIQFAESGARIAVNYRTNREAAEQTLAELAGDGHVLLQGDVSDPSAVQSMTRAAIGEMGQIDVLVNNAGIHIDHPIADVGLDAWHEAWQGTLATNLVGPANLSYCVARHMMERGGCRIVNVSSRGAFRGEPNGPAYGASKAGMNAMSQSLAKALAPHNVFVFVVAPGFVETDMAALGWAKQSMSA